VRPSHTYDKTLVPFDGGWTVLGRMLAGKPVIVHGDGTSLWTLTGAREIVEWYLADPARQVTDASLDAVMDKLAAAWSQR